MMHSVRVWDTSSGAQLKVLNRPYPYYVTSVALL
jgi:hypothetical protein